MLPPSFLRQRHGRRKPPGMALVGALVLLPTLASSSPTSGNDDPAKLAVACDTPGKTKQTRVTVANTTLEVTCPGDKYVIEPAAGETPDTQMVYVNAQCKETRALTFYCPNATAQSSPQGTTSGLALKIPEVPAGPETFYLQCKAPASTAGQNCLVEVSVQNTGAGGQRQAREQGITGEKDQVSSGGPAGSVGGGAGAEGGGGDAGTDGSSDQGNNQSQAGGSGAGSSDTPGGQQNQSGRPDADGTAGTGGTAGAQICAHEKTSITIRIPEQGSAAQFACGSGFSLYPSEAEKIFSKNCVTQETLKDMTRTQAPAAASPGVTRTPEPPAAPSPVVYTLTANKKPPKKKLCYLCAKSGVSESDPGTIEHYCTIYVESGACGRFGPGLTLALMLPSALAVLHLT